VKHTLLALALVVTGYALGSVRVPVRADDNQKLQNLLSSIERSQRTIADASKVIARSSEKCAR